jgi:phosphoribosylcarboxyaminoimidazole (NCAIR) mutase
MRLMFIGSIPGHVRGEDQALRPEHRPLLDAARELGTAAAEASHRVLIGSTSPWTIDFHVIKGVETFCKEHPDRVAHIEMHRPEGKPPIPSTYPSNLHFVPCVHHADPDSKWSVAHARAADEADVIVAIGGSTNTRLVGHLAADRGKPVIAIPSFGGAGEELFHSVRYVLAGMDVEAKTVLSAWNSGSARSIIRLAERILATTRSPSPHTYFLSYSWSDCAAADHTEALLRRQHRPVLRDEADLRAGGRLSKGVEALIEECDTFLAIWSPRYAQSSWCPQELEYSINLHHAGKKPNRIVLLVLEDHPRPLRLTDQLSLQGVDRNARELAMVRLIRGES